MEKESEQPQPDNIEKFSELTSKPLRELTDEELFDVTTNELQRDGISDTNKDRVLSYLEAIKRHDVDTYTHSLRVGLLASRASRIAEIQEKPMLLAGLLHDLGKIEVNSSTLTKKSDFTEADYAEVKEHVLKGFNMLKDEFAYSAAILAQHHSFQENSYPAVLPEFHKFLAEHKNEITQMAQLISLIDYYDAITTRNNQKFQGDTLDSETVKSILVKNFPDSKDLIIALYEARVLL